MIGEMPPKDPAVEYQALKEGYLDPETLSDDEIERVLKEGQIANLHLIEELGQPVSPHRDQVFTGELGEKHRDVVYEAEVTSPEGKKILVVYKPDKGVGLGSLKDEELNLPPDSSSHSNKEGAAWIVAKALGLTHLTMPTIKRDDLPEGAGSIRPYIWGKSLALLPRERTALALQDRKRFQEIAFFDYVVMDLDRRNENLIYSDSDKLLLIDNSLTFFDDSFANNFHVKGPRVSVAFDHTTNPPQLKNEPLPQELVQSLQGLLEHEDNITQELSSLLSPKEISDLFKRARRALETGTFL